MKALYKNQLEDREKLAARLHEAENVVNARIQDFNAAMGRERDRLEKAIEELNVVIAEVNAWREEVVGDMESYTDERSEKWHESESGLRFREWQNEYETEFQEVTIELPEELPEIEESPADILENLPEEA